MLTCGGMQTLPTLTFTQEPGRSINFSHFIAWQLDSDCTIDLLAFMLQLLS